MCGGIREDMGGRGARLVRSRGVPGLTWGALTVYCGELPGISVPMVLIVPSSLRKSTVCSREVSTIVSEVVMLM